MNHPTADEIIRGALFDDAEGCCNHLDSEYVEHLIGALEDGGYEIVKRDDSFVGRLMREQIERRDAKAAAESPGLPSESPATPRTGVPTPTDSPETESEDTQRLDVSVSDSPHGTGFARLHAGPYVVDVPRTQLDTPGGATRALAQLDRLTWPPPVSEDERHLGPESINTAADVHPKAPK